MTLWRKRARCLADTSQVWRTPSWSSGRKYSVVGGAVDRTSLMNSVGYNGYINLVLTDGKQKLKIPPKILSVGYPSFYDCSALTIWKRVTTKR